jgi:hypothetical protein
MNIGHEEKTHIARYLSFLLSAEKIAYHCASRQVNLCDSVQEKHFLIRQSRQEKFHAATFQSAILWLTPKGVSTPAKKQLQQYDSLLMNATENNDLFSSILGLQVVLEGMGDIALSHFDHGIEQRGLGYRKLRRTILTQEDSHHDFGLHYLKQHPLPVKSRRYTDDKVDCYLSLINDMLASLQGLFDFFDEDAGDYLAEFNHKLPGQLRHNDLNHHPYP